METCGSLGAAATGVFCKIMHDNQLWRTSDLLNLLLCLFCVGSDELEGKDFEDFVEAASAKKWKKAGKKLRQTVWCQKHRHRCEDDAARIRQGCDAISMVIDAAARA